MKSRVVSNGETIVVAIDHGQLVLVCAVEKGEPVTLMCKRLADKLLTYRMFVIARRHKLNADGSSK